MHPESVTGNSEYADRDLTQEYRCHRIHYHAPSPVNRRGEQLCSSRHLKE